MLFRSKREVELAAQKRTEVELAKREVELAAAKRREAEVATKRETDLAAQKRNEAELARRESELAAAKRREADIATKRENELAAARRAQAELAKRDVELAAAKRREAEVAATAPNRGEVAARANDQRRRAPVSISEGLPIDDGGRGRIANVSFKGKNGSGEVFLAMPAGVRVTEGVRTKTRAELVVDGVELDARLERNVDLTDYGSPVRAMTTRRDPRVANRVIVSIELLVPSSAKIERTAGGVRWRIVENAVW